MFADGFLSITLAELLGLLVTVVGIWLVVRQLHEAKLASQMEGLLDLQNQFTDLYSERMSLEDLATTKEWLKLSPKEAYSNLKNNEAAWASYIRIGNLFEVSSVLVDTRALSRSLVFNTYGPPAARMYRLLEKVTKEHRLFRNDETLYEYWEWLTVMHEKEIS